MSDDIAIKVENLTKIYKLFDSPKDRLKEILHPLRRQYHKDFYALNDVSFEIKKGEKIGVIGRNGSGKSTLLKLITGVLTPTSGTVTVNGSISALLELGAGFNPELTGIENIYFNCTLMGYSRQEIDQKIDNILSFADIGDYVYQAVKTYSSGMFVRLAFAVQAAADPEILIVDEALAVGDALFQKRCHQKMESLVENGTTLIFVSHDQELIRTLTTRSILLKNGVLDKIGVSSEVVLEYRRFLHEEESLIYQENADIFRVKINDNFSFGDGDAEIISVSVFDQHNEKNNIFYPGDVINIRVCCRVNKDIDNLNIGIRIRNKEGVKIYSWGTLNQDIAIWSGKNKGEIFWDKEFIAGQIFEVNFNFICSLGKNFYEIQASVTQEKDKYYKSQRMLHWKDEATFFNVNISSNDYYYGGICDLGMKAVFST